MMGVALVEPEQATSLVVVDGQCAAVEAWAARCESIPELQDANNKLAAIGEYLDRTSTEGRGRVAAAMRRLEIRIGELLPRHQGVSLLPNDEEVVSPQLKTAFRQMAAAPEVVEQVITESTDEAPASRNKVMGAVTAMSRLEEAKKNNPVEPPAFKSRIAVEARETAVREMAAAALGSRQIAARLGIGLEAVRVIANRIGVEIPADKIIGRILRHDPNRVVQAVIDQAASLDAGTDLIDLAAVDGDHIEGWVNSLSESIRFLTTLKNDLKKELTRRG